MATKMKRLSLYLRTIILLVWTHNGEGYSCPYGRRCGYDPAPPGRTPTCALPGLTYCVHPEPYPEEIIRSLVEAGQYNINTLLSDESREEFKAHKYDSPYGYGPNSLPNVDQISIVNEPAFPSYHKYNFNQKTPLQPPSPVDPSPYNINAYQTTNYTKFNGYHGYRTSGGYWPPQQTIHDYDYGKKTYRPNPSTNYGVYNQNFYNAPTSTDIFRQAASGVTHYNPNEWWRFASPSRSDVSVERSISFPTRTLKNTSSKRKKRNAELVRAASKRSLTGAEALKIALGLASAETSAERPRRQAGNTEELCRVRTQYITPRAALNNRGSWKYIVNMPSNMTQLVKSEICVSSECSGLCTVPVGYTTRCEQKYIQKRLVALESNGQTLYTDIFWIPSCCQCTIVANDNT